MTTTPTTDGTNHVGPVEALDGVGDAAYVAAVGTAGERHVRLLARFGNVVVIVDARIAASSPDAPRLPRLAAVRSVAGQVVADLEAATS